MILTTRVNKILGAFGGVERADTAVTCHSLFPVLIACLALQEFKFIFWLGREVSIGLSSFLGRGNRAKKEVWIPLTHEEI